jgi:hypothetical protein
MMSSRVAGAGLALIAAALLAVSIATPVVVPAELSLFAGHPTVGDHTRETQDVYVGFYDAQLCNSGGDGTCKSGDTTSAFRSTSYGELGATGLLAVSLVVLALLTLQKSERRKGAANVVRFAGVVAIGGAVALIVQGPFREASIPLGLGMGMYGGGVLGALLASVIAVRRPPPIKLRVADRGSQPVTAIPGPQPFDMQALFGEDHRRPGELGPEPRLRQEVRSRPEPAPSGGEFDEPPDPFATPYPLPGGDKPLFSSAPQLRPLYDATPLQGGTGGLLPMERPVMPSRPPTPVPRASISAAAGIPTPPPFPAERPKTLPPPNFGMHGKPSSIPPPVPPGASPRTQVSLVPPMPDNDPPAAPPPPPAAPPPDAVPQAEVASDGRPEVVESPSNTEPNLFPAIETPLAAPPIPSAPTPRPRVETPLAPPPIAPAPLPRRENQSLPRPHRETQSPRPGLRAAVPMPARPGHQAASPTRPPPLSISSPRRGTPGHPTISAPVAPPPNIPPIPAIPAIPMPPSRAATDPDERAETVDQGIDQATAARVPIEIGDNTSQTNVSFGMVTAEELDAAVDAFGATRDAPDDVRGGADLEDALHPSDGLDRASQAELGFSEATTAGEPLEPLDDLDGAGSSTDPSSAPAPAPVAARPLPRMPVAVAPLPVTPVTRDRPMPKLPISTAPDSLPPPKDNKQQSGPSPACPQCESPMAWVEEHLRFYCKSCRMYF